MKDIWGEVKIRFFNYKWAGSALLFAGVLVASSPSFAARPLVTDDAGTVGKGNSVVELGAEWFSWKDTVKEMRVKETGIEASGVFTYGVSDAVDLVTGFPYVWSKAKEGGEMVFDENGFSHISLETKWRFFDKNGFGLALKPGITLPIGDHKKGFGTGKVTYGLTFIASKEIAPFAFHLNAGYSRNENKVNEWKDLWSASVATTCEAAKGLNVVGNLGIESNADPTIRTAPAFALVGLNYAISDHVTLDAGYKFGLNTQEVDHSITVGITLSF